VVALTKAGYPPQGPRSGVWRIIDPNGRTTFTFDGYSDLYVTSVGVDTEVANPASEPFFGVAAAVFAPGAADWIHQWLTGPRKDSAVLVPVTGSTPIEGRHLPPAALVHCHVVPISSTGLTICTMQPT
jgi:hypothetical protein